MFKRIVSKVLNYNLWYAFAWAIVLMLYSFGWSRFNTALDTSLIVFFGITCNASLVLGLLKTRSDHDYNEPIKKSYFFTVTIVLLFAADFSYRGGIPLFLNEYNGFDINSGVQETVGIPKIHTFVVAFAIFYAMFLSYKFVKEKKLSFLGEYIIVLCMLLLNQSRGYIVFCLLVLILLYIHNRASSVNKVNIFYIILCALICLAILLFVGIFGNIRQGVAWNDAGYITRIGQYTYWPDLVPQELKWAYTYATSPLANLNLNIGSGNYSDNLFALIVSVLPDSISKEYLSAYVLDRQYVASYMNASTGLSIPVACFGPMAMYFYYIFQICYFELLDYWCRNLGAFVILARAVMCLYVVVGIFMNPFSNVAICFLPIMILCMAIYTRWKKDHNDIKSGRN